MYEVFKDIFKRYYEIYKEWREPLNNHSWDIEKEMTDAMAKEIRDEIDRAILGDLIKLAENHEEMKK